MEGGFNPIDRLVTLWAISATVINSIQYGETQAAIKNIGGFLDLLGGYLVLRFLIQNRDDVRRAIKVFAVIALVSSFCMINEQITGKNIFGMLGGVPLYPQIRNGSVRSQGAFAVYIEAGLFGANLIPLFVWLWSDRKFRGAAFLGIVGATMMVITCRSSTPLLSYAAAMLGFFFWRFRSQMRLFRQGLVIMLVGLHLVMWDLSNQYVSVALTGGLLTLIIFVAILSRSFSMLGKARKHVAGDKKEEWFLWCLGVALLSNAVGWFGLALWAQAAYLLKQ